MQTVLMQFNSYITDSFPMRSYYSVHEKVEKLWLI